MPGSLIYDMTAKNVLTANGGWDWAKLHARFRALPRSPCRPGFLRAPRDA